MTRDVRLRDDAAAPTAIVDDEDAPDLSLFEETDTIVDIGALRDGEHRRGHAVPCVELKRVLANGDRTNDHVSIRNHADRKPRIEIADNGDRAAVTVNHHARHRHETGVWSAALRLLRHHFLGFHRMLVRCIRLNLDCSDICELTAKMLSRQLEPEVDLLRRQVELCALACAACGAECERHAKMHEHCRICGEACRRCEDACKALASAQAKGVGTREHH